MPKRIPDKRRAVIMDAILTRLMAGESLSAICLDEDMPGRRTILTWANADDELCATIARARDLQADALDDDIAGVVSDIRDGTLAPDAGRVIIWANQWRAARMRPKRYGDKLDVQHGGSLTIGIRRNDRVDGD